MTTRLPADIKRYLALTKNLSLRKILDLCQLNKEYYQDICNNETFWRSLIQQRYNYQETQNLSLDELKALVKELETAYTPKEGLDLINRVVRWEIGHNALVDMWLGPDEVDFHHALDLTRPYRQLNLSDPYFQSIMSKKINFGKALILHILDVENEEQGGYTELELSQLISPLEILGAIADYFNEEASRLGFENASTMLNNAYFGGLVYIPDKGVYDVTLA